MTVRTRQRWRVLTIAGLMTLPAAMGCALFSAAGNMIQNEEYQKKIEVLPKYDGLADKKVAVLVDADLAIRSEHPTLVNHLTEGISRRVQTEVQGVKVLPSRIGLTWQYHTADWVMLPAGEIAEQLNVDRVVLVEVYEYRLNPPGNRYEWDGVAAANVSVIERDALDPDAPTDTFDVSHRFPDKSGIGPDRVPAAAIETTLLNKFEEKVAWLFYTHEEPKYPDKYRPELDK